MQEGSYNVDKKFHEWVKKNKKNVLGELKKPKMIPNKKNFLEKTIFGVPSDIGENKLYDQAYQRGGNKTYKETS